MRHTIQELSPICIKLFERVTYALPNDIASRLTRSRGMRVHGTKRTLLLFNVWDRNQSDVLPSQHFCYCLGYDPDHLWTSQTQPTDWYFHLWLNTVRIYRERETVKKTLEQEIAKRCPKGFTFALYDRAISVQINFNLTNAESDLIPYLQKRYVELIQSIHPTLMPIIDQFATNGSRSEVKAEVAKRGRIKVRPPGPANRELLAEYSRSVPPSWKPKILASRNGRCAHCNKVLEPRGYHIDHIIPFTRGGRTVMENLQALCPECNTKKGNRRIG